MVSEQKNIIINDIAKNKNDMIKHVDFIFFPFDIFTEKNSNIISNDIITIPAKLTTKHIAIDENIVLISTNKSAIKDGIKNSKYIFQNSSKTSMYFINIISIFLQGNINKISLSEALNTDLYK